MIPKLPKGFAQPMAAGTGSFSSVFRARQTALDRWVAIKILPEKSKTRRQELLKEAKTQAQMALRCVPDVYDAFEWGAQVCIVMEWISGVSLLGLLEKDPAPQAREALAAAVVEALAGIHDLGFAHRDLKPANILVSPDTGICLVDFGFAKRTDDLQNSMAGAIKGTPAYMAPELWRGEGNVDFIRADLYSLGRVLKQLSPGDAWVKTIDELLCEDPAGRPASARAFAERHPGLTGRARATDWRALAGEATARKLAAQLLEAGKELLHRGRRDEAYWLLAECLSQDPESMEAFRLMERFPHSGKSKPRFGLLWSSGAGLAAVAAAIAFLIGRQSARPDWMGPVAHRENRALWLPPRLGKADAESFAMHLKELRGASEGLAGSLSVIGPGCDSLRLDGAALAARAPDQDAPAAFGEHRLDCLDARGKLRDERKFRILPFQRKVIHISAAPQGASIEEGK